MPYAQTTKPRFVLEKVRHGPGKVQEGLGTIARCVFILWRRYQIWLQVQWCSRCYSAYFATNKHFEVNALSVKLIAPSPPRMLAFLNLVSLSLSLSLSLPVSVCLSAVCLGLSVGLSLRVCSLNSECVAVYVCGMGVGGGGGGGGRQTDRQYVGTTRNKEI